MAVGVQPVLKPSRPDSPTPTEESLLHDAASEPGESVFSVELPHKPAYSALSRALQTNDRDLTPDSTPKKKKTGSLSKLFGEHEDPDEAIERKRRVVIRRDIDPVPIPPPDLKTEVEEVMEIGTPTAVVERIGRARSRTFEAVRLDVGRQRMEEALAIRKACREGGSTRDGGATSVCIRLLIAPLSSFFETDFDCDRISV
ncbi:hypothetical protein BT69DRAFT_1340340 [Atractiella rhizophila]|nr:hypothetical protein BT69DRAFT_1340340 [Atractiella rhizophila]